MVDASVALAWCFPDEGSDVANGILVALEGRTILVPTIWSLEIANAILVGQRKKRLGQPEIARFVTLLSGLSIRGDLSQHADVINNVLPIAQQFGLSAYDAAYLELALRQGAMLATLDERLATAARRAKVRIFDGD